MFDLFLIEFNDFLMFIFIFVLQGVSYLMGNPVIKTFAKY